MDQSRHDSPVTRQQTDLLEPLASIDRSLLEVLQARIREAELCLESGAFLASAVLYATVLEGFLAAMKHADEVWDTRSSEPSRSDDRSPRASLLVEHAVSKRWLPSATGEILSGLLKIRNWIHPWAHAHVGGTLTREDVQLFSVALTTALLQLQRPLIEIGKQRDFLLDLPSALIGRDRELSELATYISQSFGRGTRIVTIAGQAGSGKTVLVEHVIRSSSLFKHDTVLSIDLSTVSSGLELDAKESLWVSELFDRSRSPNTILVLHSCEHLIEELRTRLIDVIRTRKGVRIITTSTRPLNIPRDEVVYNLTGLGTTVHDDTSDSAELLLAKLRTRFPNWQPNAEDRKSACYITASLNGLPLSICLFAPHVSEPNDLTAAGERVLMTRHLDGGSKQHETTESVLENLFPLISPADKDILCTIAMFADSSAIDLINTYSQTSLSDIETAAGIQRLRESAWISIEHDRVGMLGSVRRFIRRAMPLDELRIRRVGQIRRLAKGAFPLGLATMDWSSVDLTFMDAEHQNMLDALEFLLGQDVLSDEVFAAVVALGWYWNRRGYVELGFRIMSHACSNVAAMQTGPRLAALQAFGLLARDAGEYEAALEAHNHVYSSCNNPVDSVSALQEVGCDFWVLGELERAEESYCSALALCAQCEDEAWSRYCRARCHEMLGNIARARGRYDLALAEISEARSILATNGSRFDLRKDWILAWLYLLEANVHVSILAGGPSRGYEPWDCLYKAAKEFAIQEDDVCLAFVAERALQLSVMLADKEGVGVCFAMSRGLRQLTGSVTPPVDMREYMTATINQARVIFKEDGICDLSRGRSGVREAFVRFLRERA